MINLVLTTDKVSLITSSTAGIDVHASWVDNVAGSMTPGKTNTAVTTAATTDIIAAPASSTVRNVKFVNVRNIHASTSNDVTVQYNANGTLYTLAKCTLLPGEYLIGSEGTWYHYDANGGVYGVALPNASDTVIGGIEIAVQSEMETGTDVIKAVTPGRQHFHPGHPKAWLRATVAGAVPSITASYNITSLTDTATGDMGITIATDFSGAGVYSVQTGGEGINQTGAEANRRNINIKFGTLAAGTVSLECWNTTTITSALADPNSWHCVMEGDQ